MTVDRSEGDVTKNLYTPTRQWQVMLY